MIPILKKQDRTIGGLIVKTRAPDAKPEQDQDDSSAGIEACARALIDAIHARDAKAVAEAIQDLMEVASDSPKAEPHSYDAQNIKAAQERD